MVEERWGDPRPDLRDDTLLWKTLLPMAAERYGEYLASLLRVMRWCRARIRPRKSGGLRMTGEVDTGGLGWQSLAEWEADRDEMLAPHSREIAALLARLEGARQ